MSEMPEHPLAHRGIDYRPKSHKTEAQLREEYGRAVLKVNAHVPGAEAERDALYSALQRIWGVRDA